MANGTLLLKRESDKDATPVEIKYPGLNIFLMFHGGPEQLNSHCQEIYNR